MSHGVIKWTFGVCRWTKVHTVTAGHLSSSPLLRPLALVSLNSPALPPPCYKPPTARLTSKPLGLCRFLSRTHEHTVTWTSGSLHGNKSWSERRRKGLYCKTSRRGLTLIARWARAASCSCSHLLGMSQNYFQMVWNGDTSSAISREIFWGNFL